MPASPRAAASFEAGNPFAPPLVIESQVTGKNHGYDERRRVVSDLNPYRDYEPERARWQAIYLAVFVGLIVVLGALVYYGAQRANIASNSTIQPAGASTPATTGSGVSR